MKYFIDTDSRTLSVEDGKIRKIDLYSDESFELISDLWVKVGWNQKYPYTFSWFGRPIIQLPEDIVRIQEVIYRLKPDVIIETGVAHGGSLIFYSSLCKAMGNGKVIGIDIEIRPYNRKSIEAHELFPYITLIEGSSIDPNIVAQVESCVPRNSSVLVILDSNHSKFHVAQELELYSPMVSEGSYIVATDGVMQNVFDAPRGRSSWDQDNPVSAVREFLSRHPNFVEEQPAWRFNESSLKRNITHWPSSYLKKI